MPVCQHAQEFTQLKLKTVLKLVVINIQNIISAMLGFNNKKILKLQAL